MTNEAAIENEIQSKGLNAPRLTPEIIDNSILTEHYIHASDVDGIYETIRVDDSTTQRFRRSQAALCCLTICVLVLQNGFTIVGKSACASPENFDAELGRKIAREDARRQIWALEGYALKCKLAAGAAP